jgi:hypothetical protein
VQMTTPTTSNEIEAEVHAIGQDWLALGRGPLPEEYRVRIDQIRAREAAKLMKVEGDEKEVVRERAGTEEISDEERERRRKRNEKKRKRKMEKEEQAKEVRAVPDDSSDDVSSRTPTEPVNASTASPRRVHTASNATGDIAASPHTPTASTHATAPSVPLPPSLSTKPPLASPNDCIAPTEPTSPKPTIMSSTTDVACIVAKTAANKGIRGVRKPGKEDTKEVRTTTDTTGDDATCLAHSSFDWAEDVDATVTPTPITLVTPAARAPRDFSVLRSSKRNPWGSLSRRHHRSQTRTCKSFYSCKYTTNHAYNYATPPTLPSPAPIQLVETIRHPHGIAPTKPVIKTIASSPTSIPPMHPSMSTSSCEPISAPQSSCAFLLDWSGDPLLAGLARILEVLGWTREITARRGRRFVRGGHMEQREEWTL